jgi:hypothetical protein
MVESEREREGGLTGMQEFSSPMRHSVAPETSVFARHGAVPCPLARPLVANARHSPASSIVPAKQVVPA